MTARKTGLSVETARRVHDVAVAYVPRILLETLAAHPSRPTPWCEWVDGTLVMADVSGFTAMSERLAKAGKEGAEWLTDIINWYFGRMLDIATGCGGTTLTFGGDAILLLFHGEDHERRAIAASLRMLNATRDLPAYHVANHRVKLSMSMGAHAGRFLTASVGRADRAQYLVLGPETVRTAQAEAQASSGELAITAATAERVAASTALEPLGDFFRVERLVNTPRYEPVVEKSRASVPTAMLSAYLPPFVSDVLAIDPAAPAPDVDHEHRNVTVAFVNVLGVDAILDADGPDGLLDEVQRYVEPVVDLTDEHHGCLVSNDIYTNGFKLIVAFGAPAAHEHDAANALRFANALRERIAGAALRLTHRIGVNGGFVYAGDVGPPYRRQYTVMGDAVNLSARLMSAAEPGQVLTSTKTAEAAGPGFLLTELAPIKVKGKEHPIPINLVDGECAMGAAPAHEGAAFFGRESELAALDAARADVESGAGRVVLLRGEAGLGKSRLAAEFERAVANTGWRILTGRAYEHTTGQPFAPWVALLGSLICLEDGDDAASKTAKSLAAVGRLAPALAEWALLLGPLLGLSLPMTDVARSLDPNNRRERMFDLVSELLIGAATDAPLLVHLEDAHWADASSLDLLVHVASRLSKARVLLLVTERLEKAPDLDIPPDMTVTIDLTELPRDAALGMIRDALGVDLPPAGLQIVLEKTKGNPLFLQEVARQIGRSEAILQAKDEHELERALAEIDIPDRIQGLLMSGIDSLSRASRDVLRMSSVMGTRFELATLRGAFGDTIGLADLDDRLSDLVSQSLLLESRSGRARRYDFRHALIQEVAYDSLAFAKRRQMHHRIAEYLEDSRRGDLESIYESLVHHYRLSRDRPKTRVFAVRAGDKARGLLAYEEAIGHYRVGMESVGAHTSAAAFARSYLMEQIGGCYDQIGRHGLAAEAYKDALARCTTQDARVAAAGGAVLGLSVTPPARSREAHLCYRVGFSYTRTHRDYERSLTWLDRATRALPPREAVLRSWIDATRGSAVLWMGAHEEAVLCARRAFAAARRRGDSELQALTATTLAGALQELGDAKRSMHYDLRALEACRETADLRGQALAYANIASGWFYQGRFDQALEHTRRAIETQERIGDLTAAAIAHCNVAEILNIHGEYDDAIEHLQVARQMCERVGGGDTTVLGFTLLNLARAYARKDRHDEACDYLEESVARLKRAGATTFLAEARLHRAELLLASGQLSAAFAQCQRGLAEARALGMKFIEMRGLRLQGRIAADRGDVEGAEHDLRESEELARRAGAPYDRGLALLDLAEVRSAAGRPYRRMLATASALLAPTGAAPDIERARALEASSA